MSPPRAYWKGHLRLSLVSIDVALFAATESGGGVKLRQIHRETGRPVRYQKTVDGVGPVETDAIAKGFELGEDRFVVLEPDELEEIKLESRRAIRLAQFVDQDEIDPRYYERPYYLTPDGEAAAEGYAVIRAALRKTRKVALGQMTMRGRESLVAVKPCGDGLLLETLRYADEVRSSDAVFSEIPEVEIEDEMLALAEELIERRSAAFEPEAYRDSYAVALRELIERKKKGDAVVSSDVGEARRGGEVVDLMEALKKSLREKSGRGGGKSGGGSRSGKKPPSRSKSGAKSRAAARAKAG